MSRLLTVSALSLALLSCSEPESASGSGRDADAPALEVPGGSRDGPPEYGDTWDVGGGDDVEAAHDVSMVSPDASPGGLAGDGLADEGDELVADIDSDTSLVEQMDAAWYDSTPDSDEPYGLDSTATDDVETGAAGNPPDTTVSADDMLDGTGLEITRNHEPDAVDSDDAAADADGPVSEVSPAEPTDAADAGGADPLDGETGGEVEVALEDIFVFADGAEVQALDLIDVEEAVDGGPSAADPIPACATADGAIPCLRWSDELWVGFTEDTLPSIGVPVGEVPALRAPLSPTLNFQGEVLAAGSGWFWAGKLGLLLGRNLRKYSTTGESVLLKGTADCVTCITNGSVLVNDSPSGIWRVSETPGVADGKVGDASSWACPVALVEPGWMAFTYLASLTIVNVEPWTGQTQGFTWDKTDDDPDRGVAASGDWLWSATKGYVGISFATTCGAGDCAVDYAGATIANGSFAPMELAVKTNGSLVAGNTSGGIHGTLQPMLVYDTVGRFDAGVVVGAGDVAYAGNTSGWIHAVALNEYDESSFVWSTDTGAPIQTAATLSANGLLYVANEAPSLLALQQATGDIVWQVPIPGRPAQRSAPLTKEGLLYVVAGTQLLALQVEPGGLASGPWPKTGFDNQMRGNSALLPDVPQL